MRALLTDNLSLFRTILFRTLPVTTATVVWVIVSFQVHPVAMLQSLVTTPVPLTPTASFLWVLVPLCALLGLITAGFSTLRNRALAASGLISFATVLVAFAPPTWVLFVLVGLWVATVAYVLWKKINGDLPHESYLAEGCCLVAILAVGSWFRFAVLTGLLHLPLDIDAITFMATAEKSNIWNTGAREPLFIWMIKGMALFAGGYSAEALRLFGILLSLLTIIVLFYFVRRFIGLLAAVVASTLYAVAPAFVFSAPRGLREDTNITFFLLLVFVFLRVRNRAPRTRDYVIFGVLLSLNIGLRMSSWLLGAGMLAMLFGWSIWRHGVSPRKIWQPIMALLIAFAPYLPYFVYAQREFGDPFKCVNIIAEFYANNDFAGQPGWPSVEEVEADSFCGPPTTMAQYMFVLQTPQEILSKTLNGFFRLYLSPRWTDFPYCSAPLWDRYGYELIYHFGNFNPQSQPLLKGGWVHGSGYHILHVLGLLAMLLPGRRMILFLVFAYHAPGLFLASKVDFDWRLLTLAMASFYIGTGAFAQSAGDLVIAGWRRLSADEKKDESESAQINSTVNHLKTSRRSNKRKNASNRT